MSFLSGVKCTVLPSSHPPLLLFVFYFLPSFKWHRFEPYQRNIQTHSQFIVPKRAYLGEECEATSNYLLQRYFSTHLPQRCSITVVATFEKETCLHRSGVCACDRQVVKSHFSGILRFIIQMTSSKIRSPQQPLSSQMWTWPSPPPAPESHYHRP